MKNIPLYHLKQKRKKKRRKKRKTGGSILYRNFCRSKIDKKESPNLWLEPQEILDFDKAVDSNIIKILMKTKKFVLKIEPYKLRKHHINNQIKWYKQLNEIDNGNFIKYICSFTCNNDHELIKNSNKPELFCTSKTKRNYSRAVIIEYINGKDLDDFKINNIDLFYSIYGQLALSYIEAYFKYGFIYNDYATDNILVRKTKKSSKIYKILGKYYKIKTRGYEPVFFDFGITSMDINKHRLNRAFKQELETIITGVSNTNKTIENKVRKIYKDIDQIQRSHISNRDYAKKILEILVKHYPIKT